MGRAFRAAGVVSIDRCRGLRLTDADEAHLSDEALIAAAQDRLGAAGIDYVGSIAVGRWSMNRLYVDRPVFEIEDTVPTEYDEGAEDALQRAAARPFDRRLPVDMAHWAAQGVLAELADRKGLDDVLASVRDDVRAELVDVVAAIFRRCARTSS